MKRPFCHVKARKKSQSTDHNQSRNLMMTSFRAVTVDFAYAGQRGCGLGLETHQSLVSISAILPYRAQDVILPTFFKATLIK